MSENDYLAAKLVQLFWAWDLPLVCWWLEDLCKHSFAWDSNCIARSRELYIHDFRYGSACFFLSRSIRQNDPLSGKVVVLLWSGQSCWFSIEMITNGNMTKSWFMGGATMSLLWRVHMSHDGCCCATIFDTQLSWRRNSQVCWSFTRDYCERARGFLANGRGRWLCKNMGKLTNRCWEIWLELASCLFSVPNIRTTWGLLADMRYVDLQAMAGSLTEDNYIGEHEIIRQGSEVERIIFVKSGFCKIVRELHPK